MTKGQVLSGEFGKILVREKSEQKIELGELLITDTKEGKILLQVFDLIYGSQISQLNLELISGMKLEEDADMEMMDAKLRNYNLARMKNLITIKDNNAVVCKSLPNFFSEIREITKDDLSFLTKPKNPLFIGNLRSGSKIMDVDIFLDGEKVFAHHILIPATTGRGKSLDENEEVLIKTNNSFLIKSIGELVNNNSDFQGSNVISMNPKNYTSDFKKIINFVKHKAPRFMYKVITESGREILVTGDHNLYVMRDGNLKLLKTTGISKHDYVPLPLSIKTSGNLKELNLFNLLQDEKNVFVIYNKNITPKLKPKDECIKILAEDCPQPLHKYYDFVNRKKRIRITVLKKLLKEGFSTSDLKSIELTDHLNSVKIRALYPITKELLELIGYYIAEGYSPNDNSFKISCSEKQIQSHLIGILKKIGLNYSFCKKNRENTDLAISSSIFTKIFRKFKIGEVSGNKRLPNFFVSLSDNNLRTLLRTYFEGDGGVDKETAKENRRIKISTTTKSKKLASDIGIALLRFGILARLKKRKGRATNTNHKGDIYYRVVISGKSNLQNFLSRIGFKFKRKNLVLKGKLNYKENTNVDLIPVDPNDFRARRTKTGLIQKQFANKLDYCQQTISCIENGKRRPSRDLFELVISKFKSFDNLSYLLNFRWDKIKEIKKIKYNKKYVYDLTIKDNKTFLAGHGGMFVHNSNLTSNILWDCLDKDYCGILVLDPHDEYYGRNKLGLKDHEKKENLVYYTPKNPPPGCKTLKINLALIKPQHFNGVAEFSDPQQQALNLYYKKYGSEWIDAIILEKPLTEEKDGKQFFREETLAVVKRQLLYLLDLEFANNQVSCNGVFCLNAGEATISDICSELENAKTVVIDTSTFSGAVELLVGSLITTEVFNKYKYYKTAGELMNKPVISVVLEEAPRVLGKEVLEKGPNIFSTIAREGRKFRVGLTAITQLPSLIPREILANMNTKIILGTEMKPERQAIIESASQDLSDDDRNIASLDTGEAIITSNFARFATPIKIPFFDEIVKNSLKENKSIKKDFTGIN